MKQIQEFCDKLQIRLENFGSKLTKEQLEEFRQILFDLHILHNGIGDVYKYAELSLIPRDKPIAGQETATSAQSVNTDASVLPLPSPTFKPATKQSLTDLTMTLAKNLDLHLRKE